jgi:hypothetical protein
MRRNVKKILSEWAETTDIQGPRYIKNAEGSCLRAFWAFAFIISFAIFAFQSYHMLVIYVEERTVTKISYEPIGLETEKMLQIVYCPADWLNFTKASADPNLDWETLLYAVQFLAVEFDSPSPVIKRIIELYTGNSSVDEYFYAKNFALMLRNESDLERKLENYMRLKNLTTLKVAVLKFTQRHRLIRKLKRKFEYTYSFDCRKIFFVSVSVFAQNYAYSAPGHSLCPW